MRSLIVAAIAAALFAAGPVRAQTPATSIAPENLAAARDLLRAMKAADQYKAMVPTLLANLKPTIVQNRPEVEKQYDAMMPTLQQHEMQRVDELTEAVVGIYVPGVHLAKANSSANAPPLPAALVCRGTTSL